MKGDNMINYGLKPCPFCGQDANEAITHIEMIPTGITEIRINCCMLHILETDKIYFNGEPYPRDDLVKVWNTREGGQHENN